MKETMNMHSIAPAPNSTFSVKRLGRGIGSGTGKTSGKGHKGQNARSGGGVRIGFEGGQMPIIRQLPKRGFTNNWRSEYTVINVSSLEQFKDGTVITAEFLKNKGVISKIQPYGLKVIGNGIFTKKLTVKAAKFSETASRKITEAGGIVEVL